MKYIARLKLALCGIQDLFTRQARTGVQHGQHVLELVPETEGSTGLVQR